MSAIYFTSVQIDLIRDAYEQAKITGKYDGAYRTVANMLPWGKVRNWFEGAEQANAGEGAFAVLIREYSKRQMELRDAKYSPELMQEASDAVAKGVGRYIESKTRAVRWKVAGSEHCGHSRKRRNSGRGRLVWGAWC